MSSPVCFNSVPPDFPRHDADDRCRNSYALWLLPDAVLRFIMWIATRTIYRIKVLGRDNIPARRRVLLSAIISLADACLLAGSGRSRALHHVEGDVRETGHRLVGQTTGAIPISSELRPREMSQIPSGRQRRAQERRGRLHLRRRSDHASAR